LWIQKTIHSPLKVVWDLLDFTKSGSIPQMEVRNPGDSDHNHVGYIRAIKSGNRTVVERLLSVETMKRYTYTLSDGAPVKDDYLGVVEFPEEGDATKVSWSVKFTPAIPGTGWICALVIKRAVKNIIDAVPDEKQRKNN